MSMMNEATVTAVDAAYMQSVSAKTKDKIYVEGLPPAPREGLWMQTFDGIAYYPGDPRAEDVTISDISHALGNTCRFGGHCEQFYSVAEHSVLVSEWLEAKGESLDVQFQGLMHDASEAYVVDVPRPLKRQLSNYAEIEQKNWVVICEKFGIDVNMAEAVHVADNEVLMAEKGQLLKNPPHTWSLPFTPADVKVYGMEPRSATRRFMERFYQLSTARVIRDLQNTSVQLGPVGEQAVNAAIAEINRLKGYYL